MTSILQLIRKESLEEEQAYLLASMMEKNLVYQIIIRVKLKSENLNQIKNDSIFQLKNYRLSFFKSILIIK